jgi:hypothetical protein
MRSKSKLTRIVNTASKVIGRPQALMSSLFHKATNTLSSRGFPLPGIAECPWQRRTISNIPCAVGAIFVWSCINSGAKKVFSQPPIVLIVLIGTLQL